MPAGQSPCRHCQRPEAKVNRPRGLCWHCYYKPGVRDLYPSTSKHGQRGVGGDNHRRPLPQEPTQAQCGSEGKIRVLEERAARGEQLWHPDDVVELVPHEIGRRRGAHYGTRPTIWSPDADLEEDTSDLPAELEQH
jgi:hypothetical protein